MKSDEPRITPIPEDDWNEEQGSVLGKQKIRGNVAADDTITNFTLIKSGHRPRQPEQTKIGDWAEGQDAGLTVYLAADEVKATEVFRAYGIDFIEPGRYL